MELRHQKKKNRKTLLHQNLPLALREKHVQSTTHNANTESKVVTMMKEHHSYSPLRVSSEDTMTSISCDDDDHDDDACSATVVMEKEEERQQQKRRRQWRRFVFLGCFIIFLLSFTHKTAPQPMATCGDCHCIVDGPNGKCPTKKPVTDYSQETIDTLKSQVAVNPYSLECNPYESDCQTTPPQPKFELHSGAMCGIHYDYPMIDTRTNMSLCDTNQYRLVSYANMTVARKSGAFVTHSGACGVCSTMQDLAAYLAIPDMTTEGIACGKQGLLGFNRGVKCYMDLGFTRQCSHMWVYNNYNTWKMCGMTCTKETLKHVPHNSPAPDCSLNPCLECDEEKSGPVFQKVAGRTRRNSGLRSAIARPCESITLLTHESCPKTRSLLN